jgi:predicted kinase
MAEVRPVLVVVNGAPGTGKTTLSKKLAQDLDIPCLNKDDVKELLFDKLGVGDQRWSQDLGAGVAEMLFAFMGRWVSRGRSLIAESAYYFEFAQPYFDRLVKENDLIFLEVYCATDPQIRRQRYIDRSEKGERHPGHVDRSYYVNGETDRDVDAKYAPLRVGKLLEYDTTVFGDAAYRKLLQDIRTLVATSQQKEGI